MKSISIAVMAMGAMVAASFHGIIARNDKDTVTVTVTADCTTSALVPPASGSTPVVIIPGTQSTTGMFPVPSIGATITPGVPPSVLSKVSIPPAGKPSTVANPPASANISSSTTSSGLGSVLVIHTPPPSTAVSTETSTSSTSTTQVESSTSIETSSSASGTPTPLGTPTPTAATGDVADNFAGVCGVLAVALLCSVALLI